MLDAQENRASPVADPPEAEHEEGWRDRGVEDRMAALRAWYQEDAVWTSTATYGDEEG